jgi:hypothetical protein
MEGGRICAECRRATVGDRKGDAIANSGGGMRG